MKDVPDETERVLEIKVRPIDHIYEQLKRWDRNRAAILELHSRITQEMLTSLDEKVKQSQFYITDVEKLMSMRIAEIKQYCMYGINNSEFFIAGSYLASFKPHYNLLKGLMMEESQRELNLLKKADCLKSLFEAVVQIKSQECAKKCVTPNGSTFLNQGSSIQELKSNLRYMIDCELPDIVEEVTESVRKITSIFQRTLQKDFYLHVSHFVRLADKHLQKHREIGKEIVNLVALLTQREKILRKELREIIFKWVQADFGENNPYSEQLSKNKTEFLIEEFYNIDQLLVNQYDFGNESSVSAFLVNFKIRDFTSHQNLVLFEARATHENREVRVRFTEQKYLHLYQLQEQAPYFSAQLGSNTHVRRSSQVKLRFIEKKTSYLFMVDIEFDISLEFNLERDATGLMQKVIDVSKCVVEHVLMK